MTFAYNADLYYNNYFPDVDLGWALFGVTVIIGSIGVVVGMFIVIQLCIIINGTNLHFSCEYNLSNHLKFMFQVE